jgi:hypothetical protein
VNIIEDCRRDREDLARVLKKHTGIRKIVEDLYPDSAHFIYELLQNAEDAGATETKFTLTKNCLAFEHNGRPFDSRDIFAITDIGEGTKAHDEDKIGRFGIGFKAVFAYTESPRIWSPTFAFKITELVLPSPLPPKPDQGKETRFEFPFNNLKKSAPNAFSEVEEGLSDLSETTLLFLSNIESIAWDVPGKNKGMVRRILHSRHHIEVVKQIEEKTTANTHFLRFTKPVEGLERQHIAIAFALDALPKSKGFESGRALSEQFRIVPASPGCVAVFFPAEKEISGLRFHLHAPFVPELSRASVKETTANTPLFDQIAKLAASSLHEIRNLNLLTSEFLGVLPNVHDDIPDRYVPIRASIVNAMNEEPLTPTYSRTHAPARHLIQAKASLKNLLSHEDVKFLIDYNEMPPKWAIGATQKNSDVDRFLACLAITEWDVEQFVEVLEEKTRLEGRIDHRTYEWIEGPDAEFMGWLCSKSLEWHQKFYALLYKELEPEYELGRLENLCIVRLSNGDYSIGSKCYFPTEEEEHDRILPRVAKEIYTSGNRTTEQKLARMLLEEIGVREVGELEQTEAVLNQRYRNENFDPNIDDIKRFIALVSKWPSHAGLFAEYWIFERKDNKWGRPDQVYLDIPYLNTGLGAYFEAQGNTKDRVALSSRYQEIGISCDEFVRFAKAVGVITRIEVKETSCIGNPDWDYLRAVPGERFTSPIDRDFLIPGLEKLVKNQTIEVAKLIWNTLCHLPRYPNCLFACYQKSESRGARFAKSKLVHQLRKSEWIPQGEGVFVRPARAVQSRLPEGFVFDPGWEWIKAIGFGEEAAKHAEEFRKKREVAKVLGFNNEEALNDAKWFADLDPADRRTLKADYERKHNVELPDHEPRNPERRSTRVGEGAHEAPERQVEKRARSVSVGRETVKKDTDPYLRRQYTNNDDETICQVCKFALPFKLTDGRYYMEAVEFLPELKKRHHQNYLALCPNHAAMYRFANDTMDIMKPLFLELNSNELEVVLAGENATIYFTKTHITDLKAVIDADASDEL